MKTPYSIDILSTMGVPEKLWETSDGINGIQEVGGSTPPGSTKTSMITETYEKTVGLRLRKILIKTYKEKHRKNWWTPSAIHPRGCLCPLPMLNIAEPLPLRANGIIIHSRAPRGVRVF
jgi:hypothetical protein